MRALLFVLLSTAALLTGCKGALTTTNIYQLPPPSNPQGSAPPSSSPSSGPTSSPAPTSSPTPATSLTATTSLSASGGQTVAPGTLSNGLNATLMTPALTNGAGATLTLTESETLPAGIPADGDMNPNQPLGYMSLQVSAPVQIRSDWNFSISDGNAVSGKTYPYALFTPNHQRWRTTGRLSFPDANTASFSDPWTTLQPGATYVFGIWIGSSS